MTSEEPPRSADGDPLATILGGSASPAPDDGPIPTREDVLQCQFSSWFPTFSNVSEYKRSNVTIKSVVIRDLPQDLKKFLLSDGVRLPVGATNLSSFVPAETGDDQDDSWSSDDEEQEDSDVQRLTDAQDEHTQFEFPELNDRIKSAIVSLGGSALPKLNWSSPKDATWLNGGSMQCKTPGDVYLLLKSSDFCLHDVMMHAFDDCRDDDDYDDARDCVDLELVLRKWCNLYPNMEFRCFVRRKEIVGISQRNHTQHYAHLQQDRHWIKELIENFFDDVIYNRFGKDSAVESYVFDVYVDKKERVWLLDFNPWSRSTDSLLFDWAELQTVDSDDEPELRLVETNNQVRQDPLSSYRAPIDTVDLASMTQGDTKEFEKFMKKCQRPSEMDDLDDKQV